MCRLFLSWYVLSVLAGKRQFNTCLSFLVHDLKRNTDRRRRLPRVQPSTADPDHTVFDSSAARTALFTTKRLMP